MAKKSPHQSAENAPGAIPYQPPVAPMSAGAPAGPDPMANAGPGPQDLQAMFDQMHAHLHHIQHHMTLGQAAAPMVQPKKGK